MRGLHAMRDALFDRDTAPGAEPEALMAVDIPALIVPGHDASHATSAARYLEECLPRAEYGMWRSSGKPKSRKCAQMDFLRDRRLER